MRVRAQAFVFQHQTGSLFFVIFFEKLGVPLPVPGNVAIAYGGYMTTTGAIPYPMAFLQKASLGRTGIHAVGPWAIIVGRQIPGMRIVLSAFWEYLGCPTAFSWRG